jgi:hypothetical protein
MQRYSSVTTRGKGCSTRIRGSSARPFVRQTVFTVLGVTDAAFTGTDPLTVPDLWAPVAMHDQLAGQGRRLADPENGFLRGGLLKPGLSIEQAQHSML